MAQLVSSQDTEDGQAVGQAQKQGPRTEQDGNGKERFLNGADEFWELLA